MPIISTIGRRSLKSQALIYSIYGVLTLGALSMVYPFALMIAGSTKSGVDTPEAEVVPAFLIDETALYRKTMEAYFNALLSDAQMTYGAPIPSFRLIDPPKTPNRAMVAEWEAFLKEVPLPYYYYDPAYISMVGSAQPEGLRRFKTILYNRFNGNLERMNLEMESDYVTWNMFYVLPLNYVLARVVPLQDPISLEFRKFVQNLPFSDRYYFYLEGFYRTQFLMPQYTKDIAAYNKAHGTKYASWDEVKLSARYPSGPNFTDQERKDWNLFAREIVNMLWVVPDQSARPAFQAFLKEKYSDIAALNRLYGTAYRSFAEVPLEVNAETLNLPLADWKTFLQGWKDPDSGVTHRIANEAISLRGTEFSFRDYLRKKYADAAKLNAVAGTNFKNWSDIAPPQQDFHYLKAFLPRMGELRWEFCKRNFISVLDYIVLHGRGILNTAIYCILSILAALIVNPLAAYALSRYKPPTSYKILLFLMLTMAFPPMVTQIPSFLMLRGFGLLNTFAALILPGLAHGYSIFLLKGFFDSLPQELYESAEIDGAGEFRIFFTITMSLSTPILAVIALQAFTRAYSNFMMALLICQDEKMWTLMPWLYQLQSRAGQGVVFASLIIGAIPTFIVFIFCQNIIMRGIVVPVEK